uniref:Tail sheath protein n=1 Tax=Myoviridae sp. ctCo31 TaxID=2825053 RepID=A0A8S5ULU5_9CAUD|nr:MAG TPA: tail sheath protein [Myoviridae sp. ctCo31]
MIQNPGTGYSVGDKITVVFDQKELTKTGYVTEVSIDGAIQKAFIPSEEIIETKAKLGLTEFDPVKWSVKIESLAGGAGAQITSLGIEEK